MAAEFRIAVDVGHLIPEGSALTADVFPTLAFAVKRITDAAQAHWVSYANGAPLPSGQVIRNRTGEYARSILVRSLGDFSAEVYSDLAYARGIEEGMPARDLKKILNFSLKVRVNAAGKRYLIIPFRHNHPNSVLGNTMPESVWNWWHRQNRSASSITSTFERPSGTGAFDIKTRKPLTVPGRRYVWGSRLGKADLEELGISPESRTGKRLAGMVNFRKPGGGPGYGQHSQFITFRTMMQDSPGWMAPAQAGKWPARTVAEQLQPVAEEAFAKAVEADVRRILGGGS